MSRKPTPQAKIISRNTNSKPSIRLRGNFRFSILLAIRNEILREGLRSMVADCGFRVFDCPWTAKGFDFDALTIRKCQIFVIDGSEDFDCSRTRQFMARIRDVNEHVHVVVLIPPHLAGAFDPALAADASAIVTTDITAYLLVNLLQLVSQNYVIRSGGLAVEPPAARPAPVDGAAPAAVRPEAPPAVDAKTFVGLSSRESEILLHVTRGSSNKVIARAFGIAEATVKIHVKGIFRKIGVINRTQAAFYVFNQGWLGGEGAGFREPALRAPQTANCFPVGSDIVVARGTLR